MQKKYQVSIHAPVRGATQALRNSFGALVVSIHAPVRGATGLGGDGFQNKYSFNPRAREGRDIMIGLLPFFCIVSIHAPVRGATISRTSGSRWARCFNPRAREGRDACIYLI